MKFLISILPLLVFVCAAPSSIPAQTSQPPNVLKLGKFAIPKSARLLEGTVVVNVSIDVAGHVTDVIEVRGPGYVCPQVTRPDVTDVRQAARTAAMATTFVPATRDGKPVPSAATIEYQLPVNKDAQEKGEGKHYSIDPSKAGSGQKETLSGGLVDNHAVGVSFPRPPYPPAARAIRASGVVQVLVLIDEDGNIFSAEAVSGHPLLRGASVAAACTAKFLPTQLSGKPIKVSGVVSYNFVP